jgi:hypothetical protein
MLDHQLVGLYLFSELVWNISEFSKSILPFHPHFISELRWNSHSLRIVI